MMSVAKRCVRSRSVIAAIGALVVFAAASRTHALSSDPGHNPAADAAPCEIAAKADNVDRIIATCSALLANENAERADRIAALVARGGAYARTEQTDRAIEDYDAALMFDAKLADVFAARGRLWRGKGDNRRALDDFAAALRINSQHAARGEFKALALELERVGAMAAINNRPSFDCDKARMMVEKAICADPELVRLDREIGILVAKLATATKGNRAAARGLRKAQDAFIAARNAGFGKSGFDLLQLLQARRDVLRTRLRGHAAPVTSGANRISP